MYKLHVFVSIAMATCNGADYILEQLNSIKNQTRLPDELILSDDCSTDSTIAIIEEFRQSSPFKIKLIRNNDRVGLNGNFERALSACSGDLIFISDQDDYWFPQKIKTVELIYQKTGAHIIQNDCYYADSNLNQYPETGMGNVIKTMGKASYFMSGACTALSRPFLEYLLPFPEDHCPQYDIYIHRWANILDIKHNHNDPLQLWRRHDNNSSNTDTSRNVSMGLISRYFKYKDNILSVDYVDKHYQLREMYEMLLNKRHALSKVASDKAIYKAEILIQNASKAYEYRIKNIKKSKVIRPFFVLWRSICGDYSHFEGIKSFAKDIVR